MKHFFWLWALLAVDFSFACEGKVGSDPGQCAPQVLLQSTDLRTFDLSKLKGKVVVVNFWATWCEPCIEELPSLEALYQKKMPNVEFVSISIDEDQKSIDRFFEKNPHIQVTFPILKDFDKKVASQWKTFKVPETFIVDKKGIVQDKVIGIRDWSDSITQNYLRLLAK